MTHRDETIDSKSKFIISAVAFVFCLVWALVGEADVKILAVTLAFIYFLKEGIALEINSRSSHETH